MENWLCPTDRQLALRAQLGTGWSFHSSKPHQKDNDKISQEEQEHIKRVLQKSELVDQMEKRRVGSLVDRLEKMSRLANGTGVEECLLCGQEFGLLTGSRQNCEDCQRLVCSKCYVDTFDLNGQRIWLCKLCSEKRELWKRSGAWFFNRLPSYVLPKKKPGQRTGMVEVRKPGQQITWTRVKARRSLTQDEHSDDDENCKRPVYDESQFIPYHLKNATDNDNAPTNSIIPVSAIPTMSAAVLHRDSKDSGSASDTSEHSVITSESLISRVSITKDNPAESSKNNNRENENSSCAPEKSAAIPSSQDVGPSGYVIGQVCQTGLPDEEKPDIKFTSDNGQLVYSLHHDSINNMLHVGIDKATNLKAMDAGGLSDPYVKCHLLPSCDHKTKLRTKTISKTLNPVWNETLTYHGLTREDLSKKTLRVAVLDEDLFGFDWIGEHRYQLNQLQSDKKFILNVPLLPKQPVAKEEDELLDHQRGKILISIRYLDSKRLLHVSVIRCAELASMDPNGYSDPYVKLYLKPDKGKNSKRKTQIKKATLNPEFNEDFMYEADPETIQGKVLEVTVWDYDRAKSNDFIGGFEIGATSKGEKLKLWRQIFQNPNQSFLTWQTLSESLTPMED